MGFAAILAAMLAANVILSTTPCAADDEPAAKSVVDPQAAAKQRKELSERILERTQSARDKLTNQVTDVETQTLQDGVVKDLERLIELLRQSPPPSGGAGLSPPPPNAGSSPDAQNGQSQQSENQQQSSDRQSSQGNGSGKNRDQPADSQERHGETPESKAMADRKRRLESDIWGHLPPALREKLLNTYGSRMLPQYEDFVRKFYEALSEPKRSS